MPRSVERPEAELDRPLELPCGATLKNRLIKSAMSIRLVMVRETLPNPR